jgi:hypothetical protein
LGPHGATLSEGPMRPSTCRGTRIRVLSSLAGVIDAPA